MENPLEAAHEEIQHAEHMTRARLKVVVTVTVLAVTLLTTLAGVLAAVWSAKQTEVAAARSRPTPQPSRPACTASPNGARSTSSATTGARPPGGRSISTT